MQPFLNPVPPNVPTPLVKALSPIGYIAGTIKTALVVVVGVVYFFTVEIFLLFLVRRHSYPVRIKADGDVAPTRISLLFDKRDFNYHFCTSYFTSGWSLVDTYRKCDAKARVIIVLLTPSLMLMFIIDEVPPLSKHGIPKQEMLLFLIGFPG